MQLSGDTWVKRANEFLLFFPVGPGVDPPETCTNASGALNLELRDAVTTFSLHTWVIPYGDLSGTGPQLVTLEDFQLDPPTGAQNVDIDVRAWDTCGGAGKRWGIGGFGFIFRATVLGVV